MSQVILQACKELVDDAKSCCADLVFKEVCLEILARARHVLNDADFEALTSYVAEKMKEKPRIRHPPAIATK
ncbi:MAG TPA: hypothetical protein ENF76_06395 [Candidatus Bathyarchaeota archaeon]|nr:MAG: hypothetical protein DRO50_02285 [Candidatus Bathyarchaeota archaeon]HDI07974.1 hypothetical protein [Candidatus Bathyarchaeota archaeon]